MAIHSQYFFPNSIILFILFLAVLSGCHASDFHPAFGVSVEIGLYGRSRCSGTSRALRADRASGTLRASRADQIFGQCPKFCYCGIKCRGEAVGFVRGGLLKAVQKLNQFIHDVFYLVGNCDFNSATVAAIPP